MIRNGRSAQTKATTPHSYLRWVLMHEPFNDREERKSKKH